MLKETPKETGPHVASRRVQRGTRLDANGRVALILPAQITIVAIVVVPTLITLWLSLTAWQPTQGIPWYRAEPVWLANFNELLHEGRFVEAVVRTFFVVITCVGVEFLIALTLALLFLDDWPWKKLAVSVMILPMMVVPVDAANAFFMLFNDRGPVNYLIGLGIGRRFEYGWLSDPHWALLPIMLAEIWQWTPYVFLMLLAGLATVPENQLRAAYALGASRLQVFFRVTVPLIMPLIVIALLVRSVEAFKIFDLVYVLTQGGPGTATETLSLFMYNRAFVDFRIGYTASAALLVLVLVIAFSLALSRPLKAPRV